MTASLAITHHAATAASPQGRFEAVVDGHPCVADYLRRGQQAVFHHTEVAPALQGRGIAAQLIATALAWARSEGLKVVPSCSYVRVYIDRHKSEQDLLA
ncbi:MAG: GNAT family N-acetyltransferase [Burkholderiales bacterium]